MSSLAPLTQSLKKAEIDDEGESYSVDPHDLYAKLKALEIASSKEARISLLIMQGSEMVGLSLQ